MPTPELSRVEANGVDFALLSCGSGPLALCLHGFPDSAHSWRHLLPALAEAGFRAVAPFQRGYAPTAVPADGRYQVGALSTDVLMLHEVLGGDESAVLIGHDWGAVAVYGAAVHEPQRWRRVVGMAVPPGGAFAAALLGDLVQLKLSLVHVLLPAPVGRSRGRRQRPRLRRPALGRLVPRLRRVRGTGAGQAVVARSCQPRRRARLLPRHVGGWAEGPVPGRRPGCRPAGATPGHPLPPRRHRRLGSACRWPSQLGSSSRRRSPSRSSKGRATSSTSSGRTWSTSASWSSSPHDWSADAARRPGGDREAGLRDLRRGGPGPLPTGRRTRPADGLRPGRPAVLLRAVAPGRHRPRGLVALRDRDPADADQGGGRAGVQPHRRLEPCQLGGVDRPGGPRAAATDHAPGLRIALGRSEPGGRAARAFRPFAAEGPSCRAGRPGGRDRSLVRSRTGATAYRSSPRPRPACCGCSRGPPARRTTWWPWCHPT